MLQRDRGRSAVVVQWLDAAAEGGILLKAVAGRTGFPDRGLNRKRGVTMEARRQDLMSSVGLLILRLGVGGFMVGHGWGKLQKLFAGDLDKFADPIGLGSGFSLVLIVLAEVVCAVLVILGLGTRFAAIPVVIAMGVAALVVHANDPLTMGQGASKEPALLFLTAFLTLFFTGAGKFSMDGMVIPYWRAIRRNR